MTTATKQEEVTIEAVTKHATRNTMRTEPSTSVASLTSQQIWHALEKGSFGIISYVTPTGEPRSSGVMYKAQDTDCTSSLRPTVGRHGTSRCMRTSR